LFDALGIVWSFEATGVGSAGMPFRDAGVDEKPLPLLGGLFHDEAGMELPGVPVLLATAGCVLRSREATRFPLPVLWHPVVANTASTIPKKQCEELRPMGTSLPCEEPVVGSDGSGRHTAPLGHPGPKERRDISRAAARGQALLLPMVFAHRGTIAPTQVKFPTLLDLSWRNRKSRRLKWLRGERTNSGQADSFSRGGRFTVDTLAGGTPPK
jgi:hypothetical protein